MAQGLSPAWPFRLEEAAKGASFKWGLRCRDPSTVLNMTQSNQERCFPCTVTGYNENGLRCCFSTLRVCPFFGGGAGGEGQQFHDQGLAISEAQAQEPQ